MKTKKDLFKMIEALQETISILEILNKHSEALNKQLIKLNELQKEHEILKKNHALRLQKCIWRECDLN